MKKETPEYDTESLMVLVEAAANYVSMATGVKQQFLDQGWSQQGAEAFTVQMFQMTNGQNPDVPK